MTSYPRPITLALGALALATTINVGSAEAGGRFHFGGHASVHWSGGVRVSPGPSVHINYSRPAWRPHRWAVSGHVYIGPTYSYRPYYYYPAPEYVPSYYGASYYPVQAEAGPSTAVVVVPAARPELPRLGLGLFAGGAAVEDRNQSSNQSSDIGVLGRLRLSQGLLVEGEVGKTSYPDNVRVDRRLGASLVYEIGAYNRLAPYVLAGLGVQEAETNGSYNTKQDFAEIGAGLRYAITPHFHLTADLRAGARGTMSNDQDMTKLGSVNSTARVIAPPTATDNASENYTRGRLAAILYF